MMDRTAYLLQYLREWQNENFDNVATETDIITFNVIGNIVSLVGGGLMNTSEIYYFVSDNLNLSENEVKAVSSIVAKAFYKANKARYGDDINEEIRNEDDN